MCLNHPETIPPSPAIHEKILFHETSPWCQKRLGTTGVETSRLELYIHVLGICNSYPEQG